MAGLLSWLGSKKKRKKIGDEVKSSASDIQGMPGNFLQRNQALDEIYDFQHGTKTKKKKGAEAFPNLRGKRKK